MIRNASRCPADRACNNARSFEANLYVPGVGSIWLQFQSSIQDGRRELLIAGSRPAERLVSDSRAFDIPVRSVKLMV
jgi:hypothetical protein